jgi:outer membrane protein assembly factor BamB
MSVGQGTVFWQRAVHLALAALLALLLGGCSWIKSLGDDDEEEELKPAELVDLEPEIEVREVWSRGVGNGQGSKYTRLHPALYGEVVYAAAANGTVEAFEAATGKARWDADVDTELSGGVGVGGDLVLVGTPKGELIALESASGRQLWRSRLSSEVLAPPAADWDVVVVRTLDGKLSGLDAATGARRWTHDSSMPLLTLRGTAGPLLVEGVVYAPLDNGRILAVKADAGTVLWEGRIANPQGQSEIERAVDIDGRPLIIGSGVFAATYQGKVGGLQLANGRPIWVRDASSYVSIAEGFGNVYVAEAQGTVSAYEVGGGALRWQNDQLLRRQLSAPAAVGGYVAVADFEGYVHFLSQVDGHFVARKRADSDGVRADMIASGDHLYVYGNDGELSCFRVGSP